METVVRLECSEGTIVLELACDIDDAVLAVAGGCFGRSSVTRVVPRCCVAVSFDQGDIEFNDSRLTANGAGAILLARRPTPDASDLLVFALGPLQDADLPVIGRVREGMHVIAAIATRRCDEAGIPLTPVPVVKAVATQEGRVARPAIAEPQTKKSTLLGSLFD